MTRKPMITKWLRYALRLRVTVFPSGIVHSRPPPAQAVEDTDSVDEKEDDRDVT